MIQQLHNFVICRRCGKLTQNITRYCDECEAVRREQRVCRWIEYQKKIAEAHATKGRVYQKKFWQNLRKQVLNRDGWSCCECKRHGKFTPASEVDHIIPVALGGRHVLDNLQSLCHECHKKKTLQDSMRARGEGRNRNDSENQKCP